MTREGKEIWFRRNPKSSSTWDQWFQPGRVYRGVEKENGYIYSMFPDEQVWSLHTENMLPCKPPTAIELHQSDVEALWSCPFQFYLQSILGLQPKKKASYFTVGEIYHYGVGVVRFPFNVDKMPDIAERAARIPGLVDEHFPDASPEEKEEALGYLNIWLDYEKIKPLNVTVVTVEVPLVYRHDDWPPDFSIGGTMDAVLTSEQNPMQAWIGEWKTAQRADVRYFRSLKNGPQPAWYYTLLIHNLQYLGLNDVTDIRGHIYEIVQKQAKDIKREMSILDQSMYHRGLRAIGDSVNRAHQLIQEDTFPRVLTSCYGKFNTECIYMPWCYRNEHHRHTFDDLLASMFKIVPPKEALEARQMPIHQYVIE